MQVMVHWGGYQEGKALVEGNPEAQMFGNAYE